jgi:quercetin 2,3-dioxygenase
MVTLRRASERHHIQRGEQEIWLTFFPEAELDPLRDGFHGLRILNEDHIPPGAGFPMHPHRDAEILTYVLAGALAHRDSTGGAGVLQAGEFQRMTAGRGVRHSELNASDSEFAHVFQIWLQPRASGLTPSYEQRRFCAGERRGMLKLIASPNGERESMVIQRDARVYSALLDPGQHVVHVLEPGRVAWLHVVRGVLACSDLVLQAGDGVGAVGERALPLTARVPSELLLFDLPERRADA